MLWRLGWESAREEAPVADAVVVAPYDPTWPTLFSALGAALREALGAAALRIDHIGSTAVPGLEAKPVIDVQVSVPSLEPLAVYRLPLERLGYVFRADNTERTKRYFRESPGDRRTHIHVRRTGSWAEQFALLFRDYLRAHPDEAKQYAALKRRLAAQFQTDRHGYTDAKGPFTWELMRRADLWSQEVGWEPGSTDA
jgi:GrpB-like predicted nucleotidyltransferase (UPF0157 family)